MTAYLHDFADAVRRWAHTRRTINALERLDDRLLDDAGLDRFQIAAVAAGRARTWVARERRDRDQRAYERAVLRERRALERAEQRELARRHAVSHEFAHGYAAPHAPRFAPAFDHAAAWDRQPNCSRIPSIVDDIALGAAFRGEPCHAC